jgi:hypothetical protein
MVASRKPATRRRRGERRPGETLEAMYERIMGGPVVERLSFTKDEARFVLRRVSETGDPSTPSGEEVMRDFYGDWSADAPAE